MQNLKVNPQEEFDALLEIDFNNIGDCKFATDQAIFDVSGIINGDDSNQTQAITLTYGQSSNQLYFNFCEKELEPPTNWGCGASTDDTYAYILTDSGCEAVKPSDDKADTVAT